MDGQGGGEEGGDGDSRWGEPPPFLERVLQRYLRALRSSRRGTCIGDRSCGEGGDGGGVGLGQCWEAVVRQMLCDQKRVEELVVDNLKGCQVHVFDHCQQVTLDELRGCTVVIGPCEDSVLVRDAVDCELHIAARQVRTRDCIRCK